MEVDVTQYTDPVVRTPSILRAIIDGRPDAWLDSRHAPDVVSPRQTIVHLAYCERESMVARAKHILDPVRNPPPAVDEAEAPLWGMSIHEVLVDFEEHRMRSIKELAALKLTARDLDTEFTDEDLGTQTVGHVLATWVAHDLYHLGQIFKSYSALYVDQIGPYQQFLNLPHFN